jgi:hypothetical protein
MSDAVSGPRLSPIVVAVQRGAQASGASFDLLLATAERESSLNAAARAPTSSATGLFQFIESTWLTMVQRHGADHGLAAYAQAIETRNGRPFVADAGLRQEILNLRYDPEVSARMAGELAQENAAFLENRLGRPPTAGELYAAHVMGPAGAARLIAAAGDGAPNAAAIFPREAAANRWLFYTRDGNARSAAQLLARLDIVGAAAPAMPAGPAVMLASAPPVPPVPPGPPATEQPSGTRTLIAPETGQAFLQLALADWPDATRILRDPESEDA